MDTTQPLEDQFSKLHPCFPVKTRIGILGAGPSGVSAAFALTRLGYSNVTVLEKHHSVGGMCESVDIEGKIYDLGGQVLAKNSAPVVFQLAKEAEMELEEMDLHKLALIDSSTGKFDDAKVADDYVSVIPLTLELQDKAKNSGCIGVHAVSDFAADLTLDYLGSRGLKGIPKSVAYGYTASGYGFPQDMAYAYVHEFTRTSMAGKIRRFKGGYTGLWEKIIKSIPVKLHRGTEVLSVKRNPDNVEVKIKNPEGNVESMEFDKIIISGSFPFKNGKTYRSPVEHSTEFEANEAMDLCETERELFGKVQAIDYYTTVLKIKGLEDFPVGFYYFDEYMEDPSTIGHPVAMQKFYSDTDIFLFWSYGNSADVTGPTVADLTIKVVKNWGVEVKEVVLQRRFRYFPHVTSQDMKDGFYERVESELQGLRNTYYVGGLMAFELTERNSSYSMALVAKHFANDNLLPMFPYVKALLPLQSDFWQQKHKELGELPGVEFPDLSTLVGYLKHWGLHRATKDTKLYTWLNEEGAIVSQRTYSELLANASCIAHKLLASQKPVIKPGDRVLLVHVPGLDFVDAFFGCLIARVLPVPVLPPDPMQRGGQALLKIENVAKSSNAVAILSTLKYHSAVRAGLVKNLIQLTGKNKSTAKWPNLPWIHTDSWIKNSKNSPLENIDLQPESKSDDLCFLQFTSGSTGDAKGVMITHGGVIHNVKLMKKRYKSTSKTVLVSWLPQYHDMGLIGGLFTALVSGGTAVLFSPLTFIKSPLLWLQVMSDYKATHSAGPNFALELMVRRLESEKEKNRTFNLSWMIFLMVAAEPVRPKTLRKFLDLTRPFGLSQQVMAPGYGLAENCVFVSCAYGEGKPVLVDWQGRVCCGYAYSDGQDVDLRIVDPENGEELGEGNEGEIWISSPSAGVGYWGKDEQTRKTFGNVLQGRKYTRTGDLGRIIEGNLFITGRIKDLIIVAGRNIYSADVEKTVENASDSIRPGCCAVVGVPEEVLSSKGISVPDGSDQVGLVVIAEVRDGKLVDNDVVESIKTRVTEEHGVSVACVKLIKPRTISKTTSGKIKRFECLKSFADGTLSTLPDPILSKRRLIRSFTTGTCKEGSTPRANLVSSPIHKSKFSKKDIEEFLTKLVSEQTGIPVHKISTTENLVSYGIDSIGVVKAAQKLSDYLGVPVGAVDIFTATCIEELASFSESLVRKSQPEMINNMSEFPEPDVDFPEFLEPSMAQQVQIWVLQVFALAYICFILSFPAYFSVSAFTSFASTGQNHWFGFLTSLTLAPLAWIFCMVSTCISIAFLGNSFLKPNYALTPEVSVWSVDFVKWWALYKAQEMSSKVFSHHLRGTIFLNHWFSLLGAKIGPSVLLDTVDITDPSLVSIGDGAVISEGALIQGHEVRNGTLSFNPIKIGKNSSIGPYSVIQKGTLLKENANVPPLQKSEGVKVSSNAQNNQKGHTNGSQIYHFMGIYVVGFLSSLSAAFVYLLFTRVSQKPVSLQHFSFICISGAFHWIPFTIIAYITMVGTLETNPVNFATSFSLAYVAHGFILSLLTSALNHFLSDNHQWLRNRINNSCHLRFAKLLSGTEAFCIYLRLLGAKVGKHCSIRAINPVSDPKLIKIGNGVHLGDFSRIIPKFYSSNGIIHGKIEVNDNAVVGSQSLVLPGSIVQKNVILGALSVSPVNSTLHQGGVYVGSQNPKMIKNTMHSLDDRIEEMDTKYKKIVSNLSANLAATTLKVKSRYFHRIGVSAKGYLNIYDNIKGFPEHKIFEAGTRYPVIVRHSNSLSADDDARIDARGAAIRILSNENDFGSSSSILDLTLKTGNAFYARTIADFASWLVCGLPAREAFVKRVPHVRDAVWNSLRNANSYAELHYYSNYSRLLRFENGKDMYVRFKLRPFDENVSEDSGKVEPIGILPPETGAIPRDKNDTRPLLFLAEDFQGRVSSGGARYIFQVQIRDVPSDKESRDIALDVTKPWHEKDFPFIDIGEIFLDQNLSSQESEKLEFNPFIRCPEIDMIRARSSSESASIDHGRSIIYEICQHLRNGDPLPEAWRVFIEQSDVKVDLSGCPMAAALAKKDSGELTLSQTWYQTTWSIFGQPLLQTIVPFFLLGLVIFGPLQWVIFMKQSSKLSVHWLIPISWVFSGTLAALTCVLAKWILVGKRREGEKLPIWSKRVFMDTVWQAIRTVVGDFFLEMTSGSILYNAVLKMMGSGIGFGAYVDSMEAGLNPEMVEIERGGSVGKGAILFGHIYEGEGGKVKFGKVRVAAGGFVGSRAVAMPGVLVESGGNLSALSLAMKGEIVRSK